MTNKPQPKHAILFVCLGNICRSPVAEGLMQHIQVQYGLNLYVDSAGTASYHAGEAPDARTQRSAQKQGLDLSALRARTFIESDLNNFKHIYVMDRNNLDTISAKFKSHPGLKRIKLLPHPELEGKTVEIPDPYYGHEKDFDAVYNLIAQSLHKLCWQLSMS